MRLLEVLGDASVGCLEGGVVRARGKTRDFRNQGRKGEGFSIQGRSLDVSFNDGTERRKSAVGAKAMGERT